MDWDVDVLARGLGTSGENARVVLSCEGKVTLCEGQTRWQPCRSTQWGSELGWLHGQLGGALADLSRMTGPMGIEVTRQLLQVLSGGVGWPSGTGLRAPWVDHALDLHPRIIIPGDAIRHHGSRRDGIVLQVGKIHPDDTVEYLVRSQWEDGQIDETWWNSARIARVPWRDPYRLYLAMCWREDNIVQRLGQHSRIFANAWDQLYWRLVDRRRMGPGGTLIRPADGPDGSRGSSYDPARAHWERAAIDSLDRRDARGRMHNPRGAR